MKSNARKILQVVLVLGVLSFFLPFTTYSWGNKRVLFSYSGVSGMMKYGTVIIRWMLRQRLPPHTVISVPWVYLAFFAALAALGVSFIKGKKAALISPSLAGLSVILLAVVMSKIRESIMHQVPSLRFHVTYEAGFILSVTFLLVAVGTGIYAYGARKGSYLPAPQGDRHPKFCAGCGAARSGSDVFCGECGAKFQH